MDHLLRYQEEPEVKMLVLLGEVGGTEEYKVCAGGIHTGCRFGRGTIGSSFDLTKSSPH